MKTSELKDVALDWAVCEATGLLAAYPKVKKNFAKLHTKGTGKYIYPSIDWAQGGPIIEREWVSVWQVGNKYWKADVGGLHSHNGTTPLIAAMRCYVASKLGDEVDVPEELR